MLANNKEDNRLKDLFEKLQIEDDEVKKKCII